MARKDKDGNYVFRFLLRDGLPCFRREKAVDIAFDDKEQRLKLTEWESVVYIKYNQIVNFAVLTNKDIQTQHKSVLGRAAVGGILLGGLGAVVGGMSGTGSRTDESIDTYVIFNYHPSDRPEEIETFAVLKFLTRGFGKFKKLMTKIIDDNRPEVPEGGYL